MTSTLIPETGRSRPRTERPPDTVIPRPALLAALGDSVTAGVGDAPADGGWTAHLAGLLDVPLRNLGRNGARARDVLAEQLPTALSLRPALATVFVGGNDVLRGDFDPAEVRESLRRTLIALLGSGTTVVLVVPPRVGPELPAPQLVRRVLGRRMELLREAVHAAAAGLPATTGDCLLYDAQDLRDDRGPAVFHIDRIHPSPLGHRALAAAVADRLSGTGWPATGTLSEVPLPPHLALRLAWLIFRGVPWLARRSRDLLPELVRIVIREELLAGSGTARVTTSVTGSATADPGAGSVSPVGR